MNATRCHCICFSPTGSTRKVAEAVAGGMALPAVTSDITLPEARNAPIALAAEEVVLLAAPVYYGRVEATAAKRLSELRGQGQHAVLVVNYGNRNYDDALAELFDLATAAGFCPVAAGAFVSEHSFSTSQTPMAAGRPDASDLAAAHAFGVAVGQKLSGTVAPLTRVPGNRPYRPYPDFHRAPLTLDACTACGYCAGLCPTGAIVPESGNYVTQEELCIGCQSCVKNCPEQAREDAAPGGVETRQRLQPLVADRREPEVFV